MTTSFLLVGEAQEGEGRGGHSQKLANNRAQNSHLREVGPARFARFDREVREVACARLGEANRRQHESYARNPRWALTRRFNGTQQTASELEASELGVPTQEG